MTPRYQFNRMELAGSLGDLGTLLPIAIGMIVANSVDPTGLFWSVGLMYLFTGIYYGLPSPVQPMKVIGAYAIATALSPGQLQASVLWMAALLTVIGATGAINWLAEATPRAVIRGVQFATGTLLMVSGMKFILGTATLQKLQQAAEPFLALQQIGPIPIGPVLGVIAFGLTLLLLDNRKFPAGLAVIGFGLAAGLLCGALAKTGAVQPGFHLPALLPFGLPQQADYAFVLFALVLPQLPMTVGNAAIADADLSRTYFGNDSRRVTPRALCLTMALGNLISFGVGGMPLCHGAGGLAAHYRFGARTAGSNLMIGVVFIVLALFFGRQVLAVVHLLPFAVLGVLLIFAGSQLALTVTDLETRADFFVVVVMLVLTLTLNLGIGFILGFLLALALKHPRLQI